VILSTGPILRVPLSELNQSGPNRSGSIPALLHPPTGPGQGPGSRDTLEEAERKHILKVLEDTQWIVAGPQGAAARLGMKRTTLQHRMAKLGIFRTRACGA